MAAYVIYPTDEQEKFMKAFLEALEISFVKDEEEDLPLTRMASLRQELSRMWSSVAGI